jgi:hypothetical protein
MNRRTTPLAKSRVYPDVLGTITGDKRYLLDVLQLAVGVRPYAVPAGMPFEALVILQNTVQSDIDVLMRLSVPAQDAEGRPTHIANAAERSLRVGMHAGEVGVLQVPLQTGLLTPHGEQHHLYLEVSVENKGLDLQTVRHEQGGDQFDVHELDDERQRMIEYLQTAYYSVETLSNRLTGKLVTGSLRRATFTGLLTPKVTLAVPFVVKAPGTSPLGKTPHAKPHYRPLWTEADRDNADRLIGQATPQLDPLLASLTRTAVFFPLLRHLQACFEKASYKLWAGEAVFAAKLLTLTLERGLPQPLPGDTTVHSPRWVTRLARLMVRDASTLQGATTEQLVTQLLFPELVYDAVIYGFKVLGMLTREPLIASAGKVGNYALNLAAALTSTREPIDLYLAYVPLVLGGLSINHRLTMQKEDPHETIMLFKRAFERRGVERDAHNEVIFRLTPELMARAIGALSDVT